MTNFVQETRSWPRVDALGFDHRLMSPERLLESAGTWPIRIGWTPERQIWLDCAACGKGIEPLTDDADHLYTIQPGQLLSNVLRHMVMRHEFPLSGGGNGGS